MGRTHTAVVYSPPIANPLTARMHKGINSTLDEGQTAVVTGGGFDGVQPYTLEVRGRDGESALEHRQNGIANSLRSSSGGRGGTGIGAIAYGFYSNEGSHGMGDNRDVSPTLKLGSKTGNASPPAIAFHPTQDPISSEDVTHALSCGTKTGQESIAVLQTPELSGTLGGGSGQRGWSNDLDRSGAFIPVLSPTLTATNDPSRSPQSAEITQQVSAVHQAAAVVRRLTPVECCRLQGFPDDWNAEGIDKAGKRIAMADSNRYRQLGNAVTVNVAERIARRVANVYAAGNEVTHVEGNGQEHRREGAEEAEGPTGR